MMKAQNFFSRFCNRLGQLLLSAFSPSGTNGCSGSAFSPEELSRGVVVIDVRTSSEYSEGHVEGALLMPYNHITSLIPAQVPDKCTPIAVYCHLGGRAAMARRSLRKVGYERVENFLTPKRAARKLNKEIVN